MNDVIHIVVMKQKIKVAYSIRSTLSKLSIDTWYYLRGDTYTIYHISYTIASIINMIIMREITSIIKKERHSNQVCHSTTCWSQITFQYVIVLLVCWLTIEHSRLSIDNLFASHIK